MSEVIYDTTFMQMQSVVRFAKALGWDWDGRRFSKLVAKNGKYMTIYVKFEYMQQFHNGGFKYRRGDYDQEDNIESMYSSQLKAHPSQYDEAEKHKIVETSYVQYSKKLKRFVPQQNLVRMV